MEAKKSGEARTSKVGFEAATQSKGEPGRPSQSKATSAAPEQANAETEPEQPKATPKEIAAEKQGKNESSGENKKKRKVKDPNAKPQREYLGWEDANDIEWRTEIEYVGYKNWKMKFGPGTEWMDRYEYAQVKIRLIVVIKRAYVDCNSLLKITSGNGFALV